MTNQGKHFVPGSVAPAPARRWRFANLLHNALTAWIILGLSILLTILAYYVSKGLVEERVKERFDLRTSEILSAIEERLRLYEQVLRGGVALFDATGWASREEWKTYVATVDIQKHWPGIQGIGLAVPVTPGELAEHTAGVRAEGFPNYVVHPEGEREEYSSIIYLEPFDWRNQRAFGYDMWSHPLRRRAMQRARDDGVPATSAKITLVQETDQDVQTGFLLYLPVYRRGLPVETVEDRRRAFVGWVYSPFRTRDLMRGILGTTGENLEVEFEIFDGEDTAAEAILFATDGVLDREEGRTTALARDVRIELPGRAWTVSFLHRETEIAESEARIPQLVALGGIVVDLLLFYVIWSIHFLQRRATRIAGEMTKEIHDVNRSLEQKVAEVRRAYDELQKTQVQLVQAGKLASLGALGAGIAHELNQPLTGVLQFARLAAAQVRESDAQVREDLAFVEQQALRMADIIRSVARFASPQESRVGPADLEAMVADSLKLIGAQLRNHGIEVSIDISKGLPPVLADPNGFVQVMVNLLTNARDAIEELPGSRGGRIRIVAAVHDRRVRLAMSDSGVDVSPSVASRLFDPFFTTKSAGKGMGMGLSLSHGLMRDMGGRIGFERGTSGEKMFVVALPVFDVREHPPVARPAPRPESVTPDGRTPCRILVVDDEEIVRETLRATIRNLGAGDRIELAAGAREALERLEAEPFDVVLCDIRMPGMDGFELLERVRSEHPGIRVALMTGYAGEGDEARGVAIGASGFLHKPIVDRARLESVIVGGDRGMDEIRKPAGKPAS